MTDSSTAKTAQHLADELRKAGFEALAKRAEANEFHDYLSPHALPELMLDAELYLIVADKTYDLAQRQRAEQIRYRLHDGEFDASLKESDDWAASDDGKAAFTELVKGSKK
jgi:hypothetical protein